MHMVVFPGFWEKVNPYVVWEDEGNREKKNYETEG